MRGFCKSKMREQHLTLHPARLDRYLLYSPDHFQRLYQLGKKMVWACKVCKLHAGRRCFAIGAQVRQSAFNGRRAFANTGRLQKISPAPWIFIDRGAALVDPIPFFTLRLTWSMLLLHVFTLMAATPSFTSGDAQAALESLLNGPAGPPPPGVTPNLDNPPNQQVPLNIVAILTIGFSTCAVIIRIHTKRFVLRTMGYEDCR